MRHLESHLAPYAMRVEQTLGRRYAEPPHPYRNDYERDRDRVLHSRAFRRLENKTQVFSRRFSDHFRDRLTHTLEVAQIGRTIAKALGLNTDLVEALALAHDVGHPPFGHSGEAILNRLMQRFQEGFDHNLHALRIVEKFEQKYAQFPGLNLTFEVREGIVKHSRDYDPDKFPELGEYRLHERPPLEAQLIDIADEIAYNCADLDDGYEAKLLPLSLIREGVPLFDQIYRSMEKKYPQALEKLKFNETLKRTMDAFITDLIDQTRRTLQRLGLRSVEDVRAHKRRLVGLGTRLGREDQRLKKFLHQALYSHPDVRAEREKIVQAVEGLFEYFLEHPRSLPDFYFANTRHELTHRVVSDYIAGMTDRYVQEQFAKYVGL